MMKRSKMLCLVTTCCVALTGCGGFSAKTETTETAGQEQVSEAAVEVETASAQEEESVRTAKDCDPEVWRAVELGLVPEDYLQNPDREATCNELIAFVGNIIALRTPGKEGEWEQMVRHSDEPANGHECALSMFYATNLMEGMVYSNISGDFYMGEWTDEKNNSRDYIIFPDPWEDHNTYQIADIYTYFEGHEFPEETQSALPESINYAINTGSYFSHNHVFPIDWERKAKSKCFNNIMTHESLALMIVRYYDSFPPAPEYVAVEEIADGFSLTEEELAGAVNLPAFTSQKLPSEWKGVALTAQANAYYQTAHEVWDYYETDFRFMSENQINCARIWLSLSTLNGPDYPEDSALVNLNELRKLDNAIRWGIKYNIHLILCFTGAPGRGGIPQETQPGVGWPGSDCWLNGSGAMSEAEWGVFERYVAALARRYRDVPASYLSYELTNEFAPETAAELKTSVAHFTNIIQDIREVSPERVLIASGEIFTDYSTQFLREMAAQGVCLSAHPYDPWDFLFGEDVTWPYTDASGVTWDGELAYAQRAEPIQKIAEEYGVGFTITEWGAFDASRSHPIAQDVMTAYLKDMRETFERHDVGWVHFNLSADARSSILSMQPYVPQRDGETLEEITYEMDGYRFTFWYDPEMVSVLFE